MRFRFYRCAVCGQIIMTVEESGSPLICCGQPMQEMMANTVDAVAEKHVPVFDIIDRHVYVQIGEKEHPMTQEHHIDWVAIRTGNSITIRELVPDSYPKACFALTDKDELTAVFDYCNRHGLWKS